MSLQPILFASGLISEPLIRTSGYYLNLLNDDERYELSRRNYRQPVRHAQYIYSRLLLKSSLAKALQINARSLSICAESNGQPQLFKAGKFINHVSLSISHDRDHLFVAASFRYRCGVDVQSLRGVDWGLVMRALGWSGRVKQSAATCCDGFQVARLSDNLMSALAWTSYEAWMKATKCSHQASDFDWTQIQLVKTYPVTNFPLFEMTLGRHCPYNETRILISMRSNVVFAVATIES